LFYDILFPGMCTVNGHSLLKIRSFCEALASPTGGDITVLGLSVGWKHN